MHSKEHIVHNLSNTGFFTRSRIAELLGISASEVHEILKIGKGIPEWITNCERGGCPCPLLCIKKGCQPDGNINSKPIS